MDKTVSLTVDLFGTLQGVGFRPLVARLVSKYSLTGWIRNQSAFVRLSVCGALASVNSFMHDLPDNLPPMGRLDKIERVLLKDIEHNDCPSEFTIIDSVETDETRISIPHDIVICEACKKDVFDMDSRFYGYPFTSCTDCGPRYTIVKAMPYDRQATTMEPFNLCPECRAAYDNIDDRRFHAETVACPLCGPELYIVQTKQIKKSDYKKGEGQNEVELKCNLKKSDANYKNTSAVFKTRMAVHNGAIAAVKGLGGFLLVCDPFNRGAVSRLRDLKNRPQKPFAVMAKDIETVKKYCIADDFEQQALLSSSGPIVILKTRRDLSDSVSAVLDHIAPGTDTLGVMLPTTPLHLLLASSVHDDLPGFDLLIMTSGNRGGEPVIIDNGDALDSLGNIADIFLMHNREIHFRNDDSIVYKCAGKIRVLRRARGYAPSSLHIPVDKNDEMDRICLAFGADLKNTLALGFKREIVLSPHIGDLETVPALNGARQVCESFPEYLNRRPDIVAVDMHPDMQSTRLGQKYASLNNLDIVSVQHHHAHGAAVMAEYGLKEALALVFDGTGFGSDGSIWGGELLHITSDGFKRLAAFKPVHLPGGDAAVRNPVRQLVARWHEHLLNGNLADVWKSRLDVTSEELRIWSVQCQKGVNAPLTSAAGRVFDAFSMLLGISPLRVTYEGEAAVLLEAVARRAVSPVYLDCKTSINNDSFMTVDFSPLFERFLSAPPDDRDIDSLALGFHHVVIEAGVKMIRHGRELTGCSTAVLSGGVMQNRIVSEGVINFFKRDGKNREVKVLFPEDVPVNDGGISLGQIYAASLKN